MKVFRGISYEQAIGTPLSVVARQLEFDDIVNQVKNENEKKEINDAKSRR